MSKARELAELGGAYNDAALSNRNLIINGGFNIAQRATSFTDFGGGSDAYTTVDRWKFDVNSTIAGRMTIEQVSDTPNGISGKALKLSCTTADTSIGSSERIQIQHRIEGHHLQGVGKGTADAKPLTASFYVKANASFTYGVELYDADNGRQITKLFTTTTDWQRVVLTYPADTTGAFDDDNGLSLYFLFAIHAGAGYTGGTLNSTAWASAVNANRAAGIDSIFSSTDNTLFITGVQLEVGSEATPFEHRPIGEELARCQRYYFRIDADEAYKRYANGTYYATTAAETMIQLPVTMRAEPSFENTGTTTDYAFYDGTVRSISSNLAINAASDAGNMVITGTTASTTLGNGAIFLSNNNTNSFIAADAEL